MPEFVKPIDINSPVEIALPRELVYPGVPETAVPFTAVNLVAIDGSTPRAVKAAVANKKHWIVKVVGLNGTMGENPMLVVEDDTAVTPVRLAMTAPGGTVTTTSGAAGHQPQSAIDCRVPIEVAAGKAINGRAIASCTGAFVMVQGFQEA